ncbi:MAG: hypothetical protein BAJALOKI3v1_140029 [Promethearchaeota archaeon]|nr:MAG: hypothetical protein BAJALOKI3v1_140029 [Candidatus Lokiarchaeota archaeon]
MILKLKCGFAQGIKESSNHHILLIERDSTIEDDLKALFKFFKDSIEISKIRRLHKYYKIKSSNLAIIISLLSTILELIPEAVVVNEPSIV